MNVFKHSIVFLSENRKHENSTKQTTQFSPLQYTVLHESLFGSKYWSRLFHKLEPSPDAVLPLQ